MAHRRTDGSRAESPAIRLLDALRNGDDEGVVAECGDNTVVTAENMSWSCQGRDEIQRWLVEARERFPGLTFESRTRHVGFGLVIDEARVQDVRADVSPDGGGAEIAAVPETDEATDESSDQSSAKASDQAADQASAKASDKRSAKARGASAEAPRNGATEITKHRAGVPAVPSSDHPMWDQPAAGELSVTRQWGERTEEKRPRTALSMPVRVTVRHDDLQVHEVILSFPAALLKRALGLQVDPFEMSLSEVQSAFIAPVGAGFSSYALDRPELTLVPHAPTGLGAPEPAPVEPEPPRRRRRGRMLVPLLLVLALLGAGAYWWATSARDGSATAGEPGTSPSASVAPSPSVAPSASASSQPSTAPSARPTGTPITLKSDLAFGFNSATLSSAAKAQIATVASQVRAAGLTGTIYVDGYTDSLGSAAYGKVLSQRRAQAVADYLTAQLGSAKVKVVAVGHGEADPIANNNTAAGRQANRRVTITLPNP